MMGRGGDLWPWPVAKRGTDEARRSAGRGTAVDPALKKAVTDAQTELNKDQLALKQLRERLQADFESTDEYKNAKAAYDKAVADYNAALVPVIKALKETPEYKAAMDKQD